MIRDLENAAPLVGALQDEVRRRLFLFVRGADGPVSRDEAASAVGISRKLAAFHLDKLVDRGFLTFTYARPSGRGGRGAGRTSKLYRPSSMEIDVSIPERRYDLMGELLVRAIREEEPEETARDAAGRVAGREGRRIGEEIRREMHLRPPGSERALALAEDILNGNGYEARRPHPDLLVLNNCPFHALAEDARDLVCEMNHEFIDGLVRGLGNETLEVALEPEPGHCCVKLRAPGSAPTREDHSPTTS